MKRIALLIGVLCCGCLPIRLDKRDDERPDNPPPIVTKVSRSDVCAILAERIKGGRITHTDQLVRVFRLLQDGGDWTAADSAAVDAVWPDLVKENRPLTAADADKLRTVR